MDEKKNEIVLFENQGIKLEVNLKDDTSDVANFATTATDEKTSVGISDNCYWWKKTIANIKPRQ